MAFTGPSEDRLAIRERFGAYSDAVMRADVEAYLDCWTDDGVRGWRGTECSGKAALRTQWKKIWADLEAMAFFAEIGAIEVDGDRARARCYCREILFLKDGGRRKVVGSYDDVLVREHGQWRFARRDYRLLLDEGEIPGGSGALGSG
jgi:ketosteroid isomerase-like protein